MEVDEMITRGISDAKFGELKEPHLIHVKWIKIGTVTCWDSTAWEKTDPSYQASDNDNEYRPACLAGNHTGTRLRMMSMFPDKTMRGVCSECIVAKKGHRFVPDKMYPTIIKLF